VGLRGCIEYVVYGGEFAAGGGWGEGLALGEGIVQAPSQEDWVVEGGVVGEMALVLVWAWGNSAGFRGHSHWKDGKTQDRLPICPT
jgi:hypothetical protein